MLSLKELSDFDLYFRKKQGWFKYLPGWCVESIYCWIIQCEPTTISTHSKDQLICWGSLFHPKVYCMPLIVALCYCIFIVSICRAITNPLGTVYSYVHMHMRSIFHQIKNSYQVKQKVVLEINVRISFQRGVVTGKCFPGPVHI